MSRPGHMPAAEFNHLNATGSTGKTPETLLKEICVTWLKLDGWLTYPWFQQGVVPRNVRGMPDRIAIKGGRHVWLEFKRPGAAPSPTQEMRHAELRAAGAQVLVVHTLDEMIEGLEER